MEGIALFITLLVILTVYLTLKSFFKPGKLKLPPGPKGLPILGNLLEMTPRTWLALEKLGNQYGDVFTVTFGTHRMIVLHSYEAIKEALVNQGQFFLGRDNSDYLHEIALTGGVVFSEGKAWKLQRRRALQILKDFGFGREGSKEIIQNEIEEAIKILVSKNGEPLETQHFFSNCTANVITAISINERPAHVDSEFQKVLKCFDELVELNFFAQLPMFFPILMKIPFLIDIIGITKKFKAHKRIIEMYIRSKINEHKACFDPEQEPKDFIDAMFILHQEDKNDPNCTEELFERRLTTTIFDLFVAGNDTTATTLAWMFLLFALYPDVQAKVQVEIDSVCHRKDPIRMEAKKVLPYTSAVLDEVLRFSSILPIGVPRRTQQDTVLMGYDIPNDTMIMPDIYSVHHDPKYWEKPYNFYPEHFLSVDKKEYRTRDRLIPFSIGPRACMGEILAKMELFLMSTSIIKEFKVELSGSYSQEKIADLLLGDEGAIRHLQHHKLSFTQRKH